MRVHSGAWLGASIRALMVVGVLYFSWIADPAMVNIRWLPPAVATWADQHDTLRTGVALVPPGFLLGIRLMLKNGARRAWGLATAALIGLVVLAEIGQLALPRRSFDLMDILWGSTGAMAGLCLAAAGFWLLTLTKGRFFKGPKTSSSP